MPAEAAAGEGGPARLSLIVFSGVFERVHYALVLASAAAAIGTPVTLFFTEGALQALVAADAGSVAGWRSLPSQSGGSGGEADDARVARGVAGFEELLSACVELGARFIACEMGLRAVGLEPGALRTDVPIEIAGVVTLLAEAPPDGRMLFV